MNDQDTAQDPSKFYAMLGRALTDSSFRQRLTNADREVQRATGVGEIKQDRHRSRVFGCVVKRGKAREIHGDFDLGPATPHTTCLHGHRLT